MIADWTLADLFRRSARLFADRDAVVTESTRLTYQELEQRAARLAAALAREGFSRGQRIAVLSTTRPEYVEAYVAAAKLGVTVVTLNIRMHVEELVYCLERTRPRLLLASPDQLEAADALERRCRSIEGVLSFGAGSSYEQFLAPVGSEPDEARVTGEQIHNVLFTSGTTGRPKGALISHRAAAVRGVRIAQWYGLGPDDGFVGWLPLFHCGGDEPLYATLLTGGKVATLEKADAGAMYRLIERERLSWTLLLPGVITDFIQYPEREAHDITSMRFAIGYANMMPQVVKAFTTELGISFWDAFGQTETSFLVAHGLVRPGEEPSLRKQPTPLMDVRIVDDELNERPVGEPGECVVRGPSVMSGYLDDPEATKEAFAGGWLHTGDVLVRHEDGTLSYVDRKKYLIKTGGENVYPAEVEQAIASHPAVQEVCVHGIPDPYWGETIRAAVVLSPDSNASGKELVDWCRRRLAGYKRPRYVQFLSAEQVPRSTTGKVLRHELAAAPVTDEQRV